MKKLLSIILCAVMITAIAAGCGASGASSDVADATKELEEVLEQAAKELEEAAQEAANETENASQEAEEAIKEVTEDVTETENTEQEQPVEVDPYDIGYEEASADDFEITQYRVDTMLDSSMFFYIVTNNTDKDLSVQISGSGYDEKGTLTEDAMGSIDVLGAGETSICYLYFTYGTDVDHVDYEVKTSEDIYGSPVLSDIGYDYAFTDQGIILAAENMGDKAAVFLQAYVFFFNDDEEIVGYGNTYFADADSELKPGQIIYGQVNAYEDFSYAEIYFSGAAGTNWNTDEQLDSEEIGSNVDTEIYVFQNEYSSFAYLEMTNNSGTDVCPTGNAVAYDADGNMVSATSSFTSILGDGETSIMEFYFTPDSGVEIADVQYSLSFAKPYNMVALQKDIEVTAEETEDGSISVTMKNNSDKTIQYPEVKILFFDQSGNVTGAESAYPQDENYELVPGDEQTATVYVYTDYDYFKYYVSVYAQEEQF